MDVAVGMDVDVDLAADVAMDVAVDVAAEVDVVSNPELKSCILFLELSRYFLRELQHHHQR
jgi:hypothetical protein